MTPPTTTFRRRPATAAAMLATAATLAFSLIAADASAQTGSGTTLTVRARGSQYNNIGPIMALYVDGVQTGSVEVKNTAFGDYVFSVPTLRPGAKVDVVFTNDGGGGGADRNLYLAYLRSGATTVLPTAPGTTYDRGAGIKAFDGLDVVAPQGDMYWGGALRLTWPSTTTTAPSARKLDAVRLLQQASFGPTASEVDALAATTNAAWIDQQLAIPYAASYVPFVEGKFALGDAYRPKGASYSNVWPLQRFWTTAATSPDQLRRRMAFALHQMMVVSTADSNLYNHTRSHANYLDMLSKHALGNFRSLMEDIALSPAMGIYLSHIRNAKEDPTTGRMPDENFARELMQLFTIGLYELKPDGSLQLNGNGQPIETYSNADVMAMAKVFTGWSWGFPDNELTNNNFKYGSPDYSAANDRRIDLQPMKNYPGWHSTAEKPLFAGKPWGVTIPAGGTAQGDLKIALDTLFNHPNVGPFVSRQLIQHLVTSNPTPAYVGRVAAVFANNGRGVRGDLGAVARAILLDSEARTPTQTTSSSPAPTPVGSTTLFGKLREPILRMTHWMRAFGATSVSGDYMITGDLDALSERPLAPVSVFSYFRPGYVPAGTVLAQNGYVAPEFQIVNEGSTAAWVNLARNMAGSGVGWNGSTQDVASTMATPIALVNSGDANALIEHLNLMLFAGAMSADLKQDILDALSGVGGNDANSQSYRARIALFVALASPEYLVQK